MVRDAPWVINESFIDKHSIDYVTHDALPYSDSSGQANDVYDFVSLASWPLLVTMSNNQACQMYGGWQGLVTATSMVGLPNVSQCLPWSSQHSAAHEDGQPQVKAGCPTARGAGATASFVLICHASLCRHQDI